eukprot:10488795-Karenia_brevis.AAC.1
MGAVFKAFPGFEELQFHEEPAWDVLLIRPKLVSKVLKELDESSATGIHLLPTRTLQRCFKTLQRRATRIVRIIICSGRWSDLWLHHRVHPIFKRGSVYKAMNYRGVHVTFQLSKVVERILAMCFC